MNYGFGYLLPVGKAQESLETMLRAMRLNPHHPDRYHGHLAFALYMLDRCDAAIPALHRVSNMQIDHRTILAGCYAQLGEMEKAQAVVAEILYIQPDYNLGAFAKSRQFKNSEDAEKWLKGPRKAGLPD